MGYGYLEPSLSEIQKSAGKVSLGNLLPGPYIVTAVAAALVMLALLFALERWRPWRSELGRNYDGDLPPDS